MQFLIRKTGLAIQPKRAFKVSAEAIKDGIKNGTIKKISRDVYEEIDRPVETINRDLSGIKTIEDDQTYKTRALQAEPVKKRGRPKKVKNESE